MTLVAAGHERWRLLQDISLKGGSLALERASRMLLLAIAARFLGEVRFGRFVFASTVTALLVLGIDLGLGAWTTRALARRPHDWVEVVIAGLTLRGRALVPYGLVIFGVALWGAEGETRIAIVWLGVASPANAFFDHFGAIHRGHERFMVEARLATARSFFTTTSGLAGLLITRSLAGLCASLALASVVSSAFGAIVLRQFHPQGLTWALLAQSRKDDARARMVLRESLPIWFGTLFSMLYFRVDAILLRTLTGDAELGAYGAAYKLFEATLNLPSVLLAVTFPKLSRLHGDKPSQRKLERRLAMLLLILGLTLGLSCFATAPWLLRLFFGAGFERAAASLRVLSLALPLLYLNFGLTHFLLARDRARDTSQFAFFMVVLNVGLNLWLIPRLLGPGAAGATVLTEVALTMSCLWALWRDGRNASVGQSLTSTPTAD